MRDAVFFLHTFNAEGLTRGYESRIARWRKRPRGKKPEKPVVFKYVVHYADQSRVVVPVIYMRNIGPWLFKGEAEPLAGAALAWSGAGRKPGVSVGIYSMQWNNPHPDKIIKSIDIIGRDNGRYGAPAVFAITTATMIKTGSGR